MGSRIGRSLPPETLSFGVERTTLLKGLTRRAVPKRSVCGTLDWALSDVTSVTCRPRWRQSCSHLA
jgi:hypothetical protein